MQTPLLLIDGRIQGREPPLTALLAISGSEGSAVLVLRRGISDVLHHSVIKLLGDGRPILGSVTSDQAHQSHVLFLSPLRFVSPKLLNEQPSLVAFLSVLRRHDLGYLVPVLLVEVFDVFGILDHESEETVLEEMSLVVFPLGQSPLALGRILLLVDQLVEDLHSLLV